MDKSTKIDESLNNNLTYYLYFEGTAELFKQQVYDNATKSKKIIEGPTQQGTGRIHFKFATGKIDPKNDPDVKDDDGNDLVFDTVSGGAGNGLLPDEDYDIKIRLNPVLLKKNSPLDGHFQDTPDHSTGDQYSDETGWSFKLDLFPVNNPAFKPGAKPSRDHIEIHPTYHPYTDGCPGIIGGHSEAERFWKYYKKYNPKKFKVKIDGNNNIGTKLYGN